MKKRYMYDMIKHIMFFTLIVFFVYDFYMAAGLGILLSKYRNILKTRFNGIMITDDEHSIEERYLNGLTVFSNESDAQNALCWIKSVLLVNKLSETKG